jgi:hypothetical protein
MRIGGHAHALVVRVMKMHARSKGGKGCMMKAAMRAKDCKLGE